MAIIGHMTSSMSIAVLPLINKEKILIVSPTASTNKLTGIDDYFFRVTSPSINQTDHLARHSFKEMGLRNMAVVYDLSNRTFSEGLYNNFKSAFMSMGGTITSAETFLSGKEVAYLDLTKNLLDSEPDGLLIVASALDTAMLCQQIRKLVSCQLKYIG